ncbi:hypothetical protein ES703_35655 [subsurface metagenome]
MPVSGVRLETDGDDWPQLRGREGTPGRGDKGQAARPARRLLRGQLRRAGRLGAPRRRACGDAQAGRGPARPPEEEAGARELEPARLRGERAPEREGSAAHLQAGAAEGAAAGSVQETRAGRVLRARRSGGTPPRGVRAGSDHHGVQRAEPDRAGLQAT